MISAEPKGIIELGNIDIKCIIFKINENNISEILSSALIPSKGIYNGSINNLEEATKALNKTPYHRGAMMCKALVFISEKKYVEADKVLSDLIIFLEKNLEDDDRTGIGTLAAAYANRGIIKDRNKNYEGALKDYVKALGIDHEAVAGPGLGTVILNYKFKSSSVKERALYLNAVSYTHLRAHET